jgi:PTS system mannose-specific IIA component
MPSILIVAHAPLAGSLLAVARHAFGDCGAQVAVVDVPPQASLPDAEAQVAEALASLAEGEVLILADAFGATPCNAALNVTAAARHQRWRVATGVNVPMLWRTLCYGHLPLDELVVRAVDGGRQGIMQASHPRRQDQSGHQPTTDDPKQHPDQ